MTAELLSPEVVRAARRIRLRTRRLVSDVVAGRFRSVFKGSGIEFDEVRDYTAFDDARSIDWNVTARTGRPYVKTYVEERELSVMLVVDGSASMEFTSGERTKREVAAEIAAILAFAAIENGDRAGLAIFTRDLGVFCPPGKGVRHGMRLLRALVEFRPDGSATDISRALDRVGRLVRRRGVVFLVSDFLDDGWMKPLDRLSRRHRVVAVRLRDPRESEFLAAGLVAWQDLETGEIIEVDLRSPGVRAAYLSRVRRHDLLVEETLARARTELIDVDTRRPPAGSLIAFFDARAGGRS